MTRLTKGLLPDELRGPRDEARLQDRGPEITRLPDRARVTQSHNVRGPYDDGCMSQPHDHTSCAQAGNGGA